MMRNDAISLPIKNFYFLIATFLLALLFFIPISSTGKSIVLSMTIPLIFFIPDCRQRVLFFLNQYWAMSAISFVILAIIACFWSDATWNDKLLAVEKYGKFLYLPILAAAFLNQQLRNFGLYAFISAMMLTCSLSILKHFGVIHYHGVDAGQIFQNHIMTGLFMSFASYLTAILFTQTQSTFRYVWLGLSLIFSFQVLFIGTGRTGYVIYCLLMALFLIQTLSRKQAICGLFIGVGIIVGVFYTSPVMRQGLSHVYEDLQNYPSLNKDTSVGFRIQFQNFAYDLFMEHPVIGNGTAGFTANFRNKMPVPAWNKRLREPHSQYWLTASEYGLLGIVVYAALMIFLLISSLKLSTMRPIALGILLTFFIGNFSDSLLFYSGTGYFFITMMALTLSEGVKEWHLMK